ncbi:hypothetical protein ACWF95_38665 [Streptomyces vinaceus]
MVRKSVALTTAGVVAAVGLAVVVAAPAASDWYKNRHQESSSYDSGAKAKAERKSVPRWLPDDAKSIRYAMKTTGGERLLKATLADGELPAACKVQPQSQLGTKEPGIKADWFPKDTRNKATARCDLYYAYIDGDTLYAWQDNQDWIDNGAKD